MVVEKVSSTVSGVFSPVLVAGSRCNNTTPTNLSSPSSKSSASKLTTVNHQPEINTQPVQCVRLKTTPTQQTVTITAALCYEASLPVVLHYFSVCIEEFDSLSVGASERQRQQTSGFWPAGSSDKQRHCHQHIQTCWLCCYIGLLLLICACLAAVKALRTSDYW